MKRFGVWTVVVLAAALVGGALSYKPWRAYLDQRQVTSRENEKMHDAELRRAALSAESARLRSNAGREALAREHGMIKPGEKPADENP